MVTRRHLAIVAPPTPGHLNPLQVLGTELIGLGHRVTFVHQGDVARLVSAPRIGFAAVPGSAGDDQTIDAYYRKLALATGPLGLTRMIRATASISKRLLDHAPSVLREIGADALIADSAEPAGPLLAQMLALPYVVTVTGLPLLGEPDVPPPFLGWRYRPDAIGRFRNRGGYGVSGLLMRPVTRVLERHRERWQLSAPTPSPLALFAQCPRALDYPRKRLPPNFHYGTPWRTAQPDAAIDLPLDDRPLIFCSLGTLQGSRRGMFATMAQACAAIGGRAVIGHGGGLSPQEASALPGDPLVRDFWPQEAVLRRCAAAVLHGGFNTVLDAIAAGVPIVTLPIAFEQPGIAARLVWLGAGERLSPNGLSAGRLAAALRRVMLQPEYGQAAKRLAADMQATRGAPAAAAAISLALA
jgi:UDP:flavonoid glycosyltransferase YjiC (YdhE family)